MFIRTEYQNDENSEPNRINDKNSKVKWNQIVIYVIEMF